MTYFIMYLLTVVDNLTTFTGVIAFIFGFALTAVTVISLCEKYDNIGYAVKSDRIKVKLLEKIRDKLAIAVFILSTFTIFIPTSKAIAFIFIAPQIIENGAVKDTFKNIPELTKLGTEYLKEILKEKIDDTQK